MLEAFFFGTNSRVTEGVDLERVGDSGGAVLHDDRTVRPNPFDVLGAADYNEGSNEAPQPEPFDQFEDEETETGGPSISDLTIGGMQAGEIPLGESVGPDRPQVETVLPIEIPVYELIDEEDERSPDISHLVEMKQNKFIESTLIEKFLACFADLQGLSRDEWTMLREGLQLVRDKDGNQIPDLVNLPKQLSTLISRQRKRLPLINMREAEIPLKAEKLPTEAKKRRKEVLERLKAMAHGQKPKKRGRKRKASPSQDDKPDDKPDDNPDEPLASVKLTYFDPPSMIKAYVSSDIMNDIWTGPGQFVDLPKEMYESRAWTSSNRSSQGIYPHMPIGARVLILAGDDIYYRCSKHDCHCHSIEDYSEEAVDLHIGRVIGYGWDMRAESVTGQSREILALQIQRYVNKDSPELRTSEIIPAMEDDELCLFTDVEGEYISEKNAYCHVSIFKDYCTGEIHENPSLPKARGRKRREEYPKYREPEVASRTPEQEDFVRRVITKKWDPELDGFVLDVVPLCHSHPIRGELEVEYFGREMFETLWDQMSPDSLPVLSLPVVTFIDGFGVFANSYRSLMGYYITPCGLPAKDRLRPGHIIPLVLGPHGSDFAEVIKGLGTLRDLDMGVKMDISGEEKLVCTWTMVFIGDMPQQVSFLSPLPTHSGN